jgi:hypothetical protein
MGISNGEVARRWAAHNEGTAPSRRRDHASSKSMKFQGPVLYSYRSAIARYYDGYALVTTQHWGVTTTHHKSIAVRHCNRPVFYVPNLVHDSDELKLANADALHDELKSDMCRAIKRYKVRYENYWGRDSIVRSHQTLMSYMALTGATTTTPVPPLEEILADVDAKRDAQWAKWTDPKAVEKRERATARRHAKLALLGED